jgi:hypothetical protein
MTNRYKVWMIPRWLGNLLLGKLTSHETMQRPAGYVKDEQAVATVPVPRMFTLYRIAISLLPYSFSFWCHRGRSHGVLVLPRHSLPTKRGNLTVTVPFYCRSRYKAKPSPKSLDLLFFLLALSILQQSILHQNGSNRLSVVGSCTLLCHLFFGPCVFPFRSSKTIFVSCYVLEVSSEVFCTSLILCFVTDEWLL